MFVNRFRLVMIALAAAWGITQTSRVDGARIAYSFNHRDGGGVAVVSVDPQSGKIRDHRVLFQSADCTKANKVRRTADGRGVVVNNETAKGPHLFVASLDQDGPPRRIQLPGEPDEVRIAGDYALATCANDLLALIDLRPEGGVRSWYADKQLSPPGNKPEDAFVLPGGRLAVVSCQKDSKKGKKHGNRLIVMKLPELEPLADLRLPRDHPELHIDGNLKEQGPSPEIVLVSQPANALLVTLDLYGAVAVMDWSAAQSGRMLHWEYLPTSLDGSWGTAFPDRADLLTVAGHPCSLVFNVGRQGGAALVDLAGRKIIKRWPVPPGLEKPVFFPAYRWAYSVCSGKTKSRGKSELTKEYHPGRSVYAFDFGPPRADRSSRLQVQSLQFYIFRLAPVHALGRPLLLLAAGRKPDTEKADILLIYDPQNQRVVDQHPAAGNIGQFEG